MAKKNKTRKGKLFIFETWVDNFQEMGYEVVVGEELRCKVATVKGKGICGMFAEEGHYSRMLSAMFSADNSRCYNKPTDCPMVVRLPNDIDYIQKHLKFLASKKGYELSNGFGYLHQTILPFDTYR